jgi:hypothetical protein
VAPAIAEQRSPIQAIRFCLVDPQSPINLQRERMARATLRISNLPVNLSEDQLSQLFSQTEQFLSARLVRETPGVALIDYSSLLSAQAVKERYSGWSPFIGSAPIVVELQPAAMKPPGSAAYGGCWVPPMQESSSPPVATHVSIQLDCILRSRLICQSSKWHKFLAR